MFHKTLGNAAVLLIGNFAEGVLQFAFLVIAGRALGAEQFGFYGYVLSILMFALVIVHWGLPVLIVREIAQRPADEARLFVSMFRIRASFSLVIFAAMLLAVLSQPLAMAERATIILMFLFLLFAPLDLAPFFDARKLSRWDVPGKLAGRLVSVALLAGLWLFKGSLSIVDVALCSSVLMLVNVAVAWPIAKRLGFPLRIVGPSAGTGSLLRTATYIMWGNLMTTAYLFSQTVFVKWLSTDLETGFYSMASRILMPAVVVKGVLHRLLLPILSEAVSDRDAFSQRMEKALVGLTLVFGPIAGLGIPAAQVLTVPIFGAEYAGAILPLQISLSHLAITGAGSLYGVALLAAGDQRTPTWGLTIGCAIGVGLCLVLIPSHGAVGAAWSALAAELFAVLYPLPRFLRRVRIRVWGRMGRVLLVSAAGTFTFYLLVKVMASGAALLAAAVAIIVGLWMIREVTPQRIRTALETLRMAGHVERPPEST